MEVILKRTCKFIYILTLFTLLILSFRFWSKLKCRMNCTNRHKIHNLAQLTGEELIKCKSIQLIVHPKKKKMSTDYFSIAT